LRGTRDMTYTATVFYTLPQTQGSSSKHQQLRALNTEYKATAEALNQSQAPLTRAMRLLETNYQRKRKRGRERTRPGMSIALDPSQQKRVTELEIYMLRRLHLIDDLNAELAELFREHYTPTGDPATAQAMENAAKIDAVFRTCTYDTYPHT